MKRMIADENCEFNQKIVERNSEFWETVVEKNREFYNSITILKSYWFFEIDIHILTKNNNDNNDKVAYL